MVMDRWGEGDQGDKGDKGDKEKSEEIVIGTEDKGEAWLVDR